jgi:hypothetical protein
MTIQPYTDERLRWDDYEERYYLTEQALINIGINIRERLAFNKVSSPEYIINGFLGDVTDLVYNFIHKFSANNERQDKIIAYYESARKIIFKALINQAKYVLMVGNLSLSSREEDRKNAISTGTHETLNTVIKEIGISVLYSGV